MALEFALRPRIRIAEGFAPPRRPRFRIPRLALPIAAYWAVAAGITYELVHLHDQPEVGVDARTAAAAPASESRSWWPFESARPTATTEPAAAVPVAPPPTVEPVAPIQDAPSVAVEPPVADEPPAQDASTHAGARLAANDAETNLEPEPRDALFGIPPPLRRAHREQHGARDADLGAPLVDELPARASVARESVSAPDLFAPSSPAPASAGDAPRILGATPPDAPAAVASALPSCEAAAALANQDIDLAKRDTTPDLSRAAIASVLDNGVWIARCDIPMNTAVDLCVAIRGGKVIGASVTSRPASAAINACVKRRAASLSFPFSARVDIAKTRF